MVEIKRASGRREPVLKQNEIPVPGCPGEMLEYLTFPLLEETGMVKHLITTRLGGVSRDEFSTMNLSTSRGDSPENVAANYERIARVLECGVEDMVASHQTHTVNIRRVTGADRGKGVCRPRDYQDVDGLITNEPGIVLVTYYADCVPLFFADPCTRAIGLAHSGWRGTAAGMGACMVDAMERNFGTTPDHLIAAIGPSICRDCYEVGEEVAKQFAACLQGTEDICREIRDSGICCREGKEFPSVVEPGKGPGKYQLDLWLANLIILRKAGIPLKNIAVTDICTCHNSGYLFSHRASGGRRGNMGCFLGISAE